MMHGHKSLKVSDPMSHSAQEINLCTPESKKSAISVNKSVSMTTKGLGGSLSISHFPHFSALSTLIKQLETKAEASN